MTALIDKINQIEFPVTDKKLIDALELSFQWISVDLAEEEKLLLRHDLDFFYHETGRWHVHNTFAGGIIFLREPETINQIEIKFYSDQNEATPSVIYSSQKRNARNTRYKPFAGQIESTTWNVLGVFPNFIKHKKCIQIALLAIIGNITKRLCEKYRKESWFMQFEQEFDIQLYLDGRHELEYKVRIEQ